MTRNILINSRKFDGRISKSWRADLVEQKNTLLVFEGMFDSEVDHTKLGRIKRGTISYEYYWTDRWYNVFRFHEHDGSLRNFYCNVSMPPVFTQDELNYVDLDLDILVDADLKYELLDMDEFEERKIIYGYTNEVIETATKSVSELISLIDSREFPFNRSK